MNLMVNIVDVEKSLPKIEKGLQKYQKIFVQFNQVNIANDRQFQKEYNGFFRVRQRTKEFYTEYYKFMELNKSNKNLTFGIILKHFYNLFNRIEASFSSKLLSIINPDMPVWDEFVLQNLRLKKPMQYDQNRIQKTIDLYSEILKWYNDFMQKEEAKRWIELFDLKYPKAGITNVKKIDLILWQVR